MVEITFLGTGGAFSVGRRSHLGLLLEAGHFRMLAEAGPTVLQQMARVGRCATDVDRLFVTHPHGDHTLGFPIFALSRMESPTPLHVYAGATTIATLRMLWLLAYPGFDDRRFNPSWHELSERQAGQHEVFPGVILRTAVMPYPPEVPTLAARWEFDGGPAITLVTDTYANPAAVDLARGSDLLIHEASFSATLEPGRDPVAAFHCTAQQAGEIARQAGCPRLALVHLGPTIGEQPEVLVEEARAGSDLEVIVPEDGQRIVIPGRRTS
jgi:ribonuclease Z